MPKEVEPVIVTRGVPPMRVEVADGVTVVHEGKEYLGGKTLVMEGPLAQNLEAQGQVKILEEVDA